MRKSTSPLPSLYKAMTDRSTADKLMAHDHPLMVKAKEMMNLGLSPEFIRVMGELVLSGEIATLAQRDVFNAHAVDLSVGRRMMFSDTALWQLPLPVLMDARYTRPDDEALIDACDDWDLHLRRLVGGDFDDRVVIGAMMTAPDDDWTSKFQRHPDELSDLGSMGSGKIVLLESAMAGMFEGLRIHLPTDRHELEKANATLAFHRLLWILLQVQRVHARGRATRAELIPAALRPYFDTSNVLAGTALKFTDLCQMNGTQLAELYQHNTAHPNNQRKLPGTEPVLVCFLRSAVKASDHKSLIEIDDPRYSAILDALVPALAANAAATAAAIDARAKGGRARPIRERRKSKPPRVRKDGRSGRDYNIVGRNGSQNGHQLRFRGASEATMLAMSLFRMLQGLEILRPAIERTSASNSAWGDRLADTPLPSKEQLKAMSWKVRNLLTDYFTSEEGGDDVGTFDVPIREAISRFVLLSDDKQQCANPRNSHDKVVRARWLDFDNLDSLRTAADWVEGNS